MPVKKLESALKGELLPVYLVLSQESLVLDRAEEVVTAAALTGPAAAFNHSVFRAADDLSSEFLSVCRTAPRMAARRFVVLRDVQEARADQLEALQAYCEAPCPSTVLFLVGRKWPKPVGGTDWGRRCENQVARMGFVLRQKARDNDPVHFVVQTASELGCSIRTDRARRLVERVGTDLATLRSELEKISEWLGGEGEMGEEALSSVSSLVADADRWDLTGALVRGDVGGALATTHRLLENGEEPVVVFGLIAWQMRQILALQGALWRGQSPRDAGVNLRGATLDAAKRMISRHPLHTARVLGSLADANAQMNSSGAGGRRVLEGLVLGLASRA